MRDHPVFRPEVAKVGCGSQLPGGIAAVARSRIVRPPRRTVMPVMLSMGGRLAANHGKDETDEPTGAGLGALTSFGD